jgi:hypothetical protein
MITSQQAIEDLFKYEFTEADADLQRRIPLWRNLYYQWRGLFIGQDSQQDRTGARNGLGDLPAAFVGLVNDAAVDLRGAEDAPIFVQKTMRDCETYLSYAQESYTAPPKPFDLTLPSIWLYRPQPGEYARKRASLLGATELCVRAYRQGGSQSAHLKAFRDLFVFGTGICWHHEASPGLDSVPAGEISRIPPWLLRVDPYRNEIKRSYYLFRELRLALGAAISQFPEYEKELTEAAGKNEGALEVEDEADSQDSSRKEVVIQDWWVRLDPERLAAAGDDVQKLIGGSRQKLFHGYLLCSGGKPTMLLGPLRPTPYSHQEMPAQEFKILTSPVEQGIYGIGIADLDQSDQVMINTFWNQTIKAFGYETLQGGFADASWRGELEPALDRGIDPGEWVWVNFAGRNPKEGLLPVADLYGRQTDTRLKMLEYIQAQSNAETGVTNQSAGISARTFSNTAEEARMLAQFGTRKFQQAVYALDEPYKRSITLFVKATADAIRDAGLHSGVAPWYCDATGNFFPISPDAFDENWEVKVLAGGTWMSEQQKAQQLLGLLQTWGEIQDPQARAVLYKIAQRMGLDPGDLPAPQQAMPAPQMPALPPPAPPPRISVNFKGELLPPAEQAALLGEAPAPPSGLPSAGAPQALPMSLSQGIPVSTNVPPVSQWMPPFNNVPQPMPMVPPGLPMVPR